MLNAGLGVLNGHPPGRDKGLEAKRDPIISVFLSMRIAVVFAQIAGKRAIEIDDPVAFPCAHSLFRAKYDDLHDGPPIFFARISLYDQMQSLTFVLSVRGRGDFKVL